ncbi:dynamin family protein [Paenibacillus sp. FA6]|uniref:dynamin family protein n=1 Tax=Paenibacillus sp. FA6 TaxID=3413029 RepID=UPI003F65B552
MVAVAQSDMKNVAIDLEAFNSKLTAWGDMKSCNNINDLLQKNNSGELTIAVCGHFSAGKSSLINTLCGMKVLPSGPVPTSANVVTIRNGVPRALIYPVGPKDMEGDNEQLTPLEVSPAQLDDYCMNGGEYSSIEVWETIPFLGSDGVLMDTPGVDSTDDGHKKATHSALHLADVVLYVMDYNHVQSENNLMFAKSLSDWGKPLYLIVNQIDKHKEQELSFAAYHEEVVTAFQRWQVSYEGIIYNSLKEMDHPYNQHDRLKSLITDLIVQKEALLDYSISCSVHHVAEDHLEQFKESLADEKERLLEELGGEEVLDRIEAGMKSLELERGQIEGGPQQEREILRIELNKLLDNSNLMPAEIRGLAELFLESRRPGFKKGLWLAGNKTKAEQEQRQSQFLHKLQEQVASQVEWHVCQMVIEWGETHDLWSEDWQKEMELFIPRIDETVILHALQSDAVLSGEYVLNYCRSIAEHIKGLYRRSMMEFIEQLLLLLDEAAARELQQLSQRMADLQQQSVAASRYAALLREEAARAAALAELLPPRQGITPGLLPVVAPLRPLAPAVAAKDAGTLRAAPVRALAPPQSGGGADPRGGATGGRRQRLADAAAQLHAASALLGQYPAMASASRAIRERAAALEGGTFTLALFGAFSAGKSSFANALLGEDVLPVSPHPTTAAINRILAPHGDFIHGTAQVTMKSHETFMEDLRISFATLHLGVPDPNEWSKAVNNLSSEGIHPAGLPHYGFLKAASAGWMKAKELLGTEQTVDFPQYRSFVADESKSCFVDRIDLFYSCDLTEQGIILVDTPGADSLHARHTGVTFQYMKYADAIVFVTYYNHAFSKGDRQFLSQLGRVKDSFALDKMFFIINASDLAASSDELAQVIDHVQSNLRSNGIGSPHIYALSSMKALEGKRKGDKSSLLASGFMTFETSLGDFAGKELPGLSIQAARQEITSARMRAEEWDRISRQDEATRDGQRLELSNMVTKANAMLSQFTKLEGLHRVIEQETKELLFHVCQRIYYRLGSFFQESFHPTVLREGIGSLREIYTDCGRELEQSLLREIDQEIWATTLRLELKAKSILEEAAIRFTNQIHGLNEGMLLTPMRENQDWIVPDLQGSQFQQSMDWDSMWSSFKTPKLFFEGKGREKLRLTIEPKLKEAIAEAVILQQQQLSDFYVTEFQKGLHRQAGILEEQLVEGYSALEQTLQLTDSLEQWHELANELTIFEQVLE